MSTATAHDWSGLAALAHKYRPQIARPFPTTVRDQRATCATNGHALLLVYADLGFPELPDSPNIANVLLPALDNPNREAIKAEDLPLLAGPPTPLPTCEVCKGTGAVECEECDGMGYADCVCDCGHEHEVDCKQCNGMGDVDCQCGGYRREKVELFGSLFDARVLRPLLAAVPIEAAEWRAPDDPSRAHVVVGNGWVGMIMPMRRIDD